MGEYYLGMGKLSLNTIKYKVIKERIDTFDRNKKALYHPRNHYKVKRTGWPGLRGGAFCLGAACETRWPWRPFLSLAIPS